MNRPGGDGSVSFLPLDNSEGDGTLAGAADDDTVLLNADLPDHELATALYHEWHHVRQNRPYDENGLPDERDLPAQCREALAYDIEMGFICAQVHLAQIELLEKPYDCRYILATWSNLHLARLDCLLEAPEVPIPPLPAPCVQYCSDG